MPASLLDRSRRIASASLLSAVIAAHPSGERNLEIATESTCEQLLFDATTLHGSITDIENALAYALEQKSWIIEQREIADANSTPTTDLHEINVAISRILAMHRLFLTQECPIEDGWWTFRPSTPRVNSLWD